MLTYNEFIQAKSHVGTYDGFNPVWIPDFLYDFQKSLVSWAIKKGKAAIFADCGLGKTPLQLVWADNIRRRENKNVLVLTPLAVSYQTLREGEKFDIECKRSIDGIVHNGITVTNYERLSYFNPSDFVAVVCDESSILKNFSGVRRGEITEFMKKMKYRLLCTATASPNDYIELGTSSEALGELGYMDMLNVFFKNDQNTCDTRRHWATTGGGRPKWRFKKHAQEPFWKWVCSWARAIRKPSDLGFDDSIFKLPPLVEKEHILEYSRPKNGVFFPEAASSLKEQREERRYTLKERCEKVAQLVHHDKPALVWCQLNDEANLLEELISDAKQIEGSDSDDYKEHTFLDFVNKNLRVLITKPRIGAFGLNFQHCSHVTFFPSHSFEQYYQGVRRCWRFGQTNPVKIDIVTTKGEVEVLKNLQYKAAQADKMFTNLIKFMNEAETRKIDNAHYNFEVPTWL